MHAQPKPADSWMYPYCAGRRSDVRGNLPSGRHSSEEKTTDRPREKDYEALPRNRQEFLLRRLVAGCLLIPCNGLRTLPAFPPRNDFYLAVDWWSCVDDGALREFWSTFDCYPQEADRRDFSSVVGSALQISGKPASEMDAMCCQRLD